MSKVDLDMEIKECRIHAMLDHLEKWEPADSEDLFSPVMVR